MEKKVKLRVGVAICLEDKSSQVFSMYSGIPISQTLGLANILIKFEPKVVFLGFDSM